MKPLNHRERRMSWLGA